MTVWGVGGILLISGGPEAASVGRSAFSAAGESVTTCVNGLDTPASAAMAAASHAGDSAMGLGDWVNGPVVGGERVSGAVSTAVTELSSD